ncbi:MAG: T9SS type A sorting domain-containing protein, partial [Bacteroidales bacterium]|nr:T9SS type A sorting domain-containing protein [Bacteroidales bacterium]
SCDEITENLTTTKILSLKDGGVGTQYFLFTGTGGGGIWKREILQPETITVYEPYTFVVYPNPCADLLTIKNYPSSEKDNPTLDLLSINGIRLQRVLLKEKETSLDLSGLAPGIYILKLISSEDIEIHRIIKQ